MSADNDQFRVDGFSVFNDHICRRSGYDGGACRQLHFSSRLLEPMLCEGVKCVQTFERDRRSSEEIRHGSPCMTEREQADIGGVQQMQGRGAPPCLRCGRAERDKRHIGKVSGRNHRTLWRLSGN